MKVLTQVMTVLIAVNSTTTTLAQHPNEAVRRLVQEQLAAKDAALAQEAAAVEREVARVALKVDDQLASKVADLAKKAADLKTQEAKMRAVEALELSRLKLASALGRQGSGVLMILTSQMKPEDVAATTEDLNIMSRIFDKKLGSSYAGTPRAISLSSANVSGLSSLLRHRTGSQGTQAIYLHGYAALFLVSVEFPLSPPPQVEAEKVDEGADPVWEQTKLRITASVGDLPVQYMHERDAVTRQYDPEKVEQLKATLIKALKHAANIRNLKPDESVILVIAGTLPAVVVAEHGDEPHRYRYVQYTQRHAQPATLTIRAKKSDIDAYSADTIDYEQFRQRVQIITAHIDVGGAQPNVINLRY